MTDNRPEPIISTVRRELANRKGRWPEVSSGSGVPYDTLTKIAQGRQDPGVSSVQRLLDYFRANPIITMVREELANRRGTWREVARGSGVPYAMLSKIAQGRLNPGVANTQRLLDYFRLNPCRPAASRTSRRSTATASA